MHVPDAVRGVFVVEDLIVLMFFVFHRSVLRQAPGQIRSFQCSVLRGVCSLTVLHYPVLLVSFVF